MNEHFENGLALRTQVLGDRYVQQALDAGDSVTRDFQSLLTEKCWGSI